VNLQPKPSRVQFSGLKLSGFGAQGFTLIEIIAVIIIIGLMAAIIAVSMEGKKGESATREEAQLFLQSVDFVAEQSVLNGEVMAMFIAPREIEGSTDSQWCYRWQRMRDDAWQDLPEDSLNEHCLAETIEWELSIEGREYEYDPNLEIQPPVLVWSPSGEATAMEMTILEKPNTNANSGGLSADRFAQAQHITIDLMGETHWLEQDEEAAKNAR
jgi:general secretion pathway protein H